MKILAMLEADAGDGAADPVEEYTADQFNMLAFMQATGSGKTLLMHVNILQYRHYLGRAPAERKRELALNRGKLLSRAHLLRRVWGRGYETETEYVRVYVRRLRAKLGVDADGSPSLILTQPRAGYSFISE